MAGLFDWLTGGAGTTVTAAADAVGGLAQNIRSVITGDMTPDQKLQMEKLAQQADQAQATINNTEASSGNMFVAGWRPAIGWICAFGFFYACAYAILVWFATIFKLPVPPPLDSTILMQVMFGMLGMAGLRTYEKTTGASGNH